MSETDTGSDMVEPTVILPGTVGWGAGLIHINLSETNIPFTRVPRIWCPVIDGKIYLMITGLDKKNQDILLEWLKPRRGDVSTHMEHGVEWIIIGILN